MITTTNLRKALASLGFEADGKDRVRRLANGHEMAVNFRDTRLEYPEAAGLTVNERQTTNFSSTENFVVFECVLRLLDHGYSPSHIELEPRWKLGHGSSGGRADILVRRHDGQSLLLIECKTPGAEFDREWRTTQQTGGQLFSYAHQVSEVEFIALYTSDFTESRVTFEYHLIKHSDNEDVVWPDDTPLFKTASSVIDRVRAWRETYAGEFTTKGLFEPNIQPYSIGKKKVALGDLREISEADRRRKYGDFATILRQHNVSGRENAFDKLVNLFLCKLVDEASNQDDLKFYWKGFAYDTRIEMLDRLQQLYQAGMQQFLGEEITYINRDSVNNALRFVRSTPDATQHAIWQLFVKQKFYTNNDFSLIDVHNEQLFYQNSDILIRLLQMWQDVRLTSDGARFNQSLGDMFEGFLDQGVKQSEGQFFTPMPLTRFIIRSLPLRALATSSKPPRVVDYACGAGHFLTEWAYQASELLREEGASTEELSAHQANMYGIEKEYRLSKVAKVSAFMYGQPQIKIVYGDALAQSHAAYPELTNGSVDVVIANPPYSVKGFLETLSEQDLAAYKLTQTVEGKTRDTNNKIEAFFIERAKQLLRPNGVAAIVLPSSILSNNDGPTRAARDMMIRYFDILSIIELGAGAFGSTGTNTVVVFMRRREIDPETIDHVSSRVEQWFSGKFPSGGEDEQAYDDLDVVSAYAGHVGYELDAYSSFLNGELPAGLSTSQTFRAYKDVFEKSADTRRRRSTAAYKRLTEPERSETEAHALWRFCAGHEREKVSVFSIVYLQSEPTILVRSPSTNKQRKKFLGYSWSNAKGNAGIKLVNDAGGNHTTPLYNPRDLDDPSKLSTYIASNFEAGVGTLPPELASYGEVVRLESLIDFVTENFDSSISLTPRLSAEALQSRWPLERMSQLVPGLQRGASPRPISEFVTENSNGVPWIKIGDVKVGEKVVKTTAERITADGAKQSRRVHPGDLILSNSMSAGRPYLVGIDGCVHDGWLILSDLSERVTPEYMYYMLGHEFVQQQFRERSVGPVVKNLNMPRVKTVLVPVPDKPTQRKIVQESEAVDAKISSQHDAILALDDDLLSRAAALAQGATLRLDAVAENVLDSVDPKASKDPLAYVGLESVASSTGQLIAFEEDPDAAASLKRRFRKGDVLYGKLRPRLNKVLLTHSDGACSTDFLVLRFKTPDQAAFYSTLLRTQDFNRSVIATVTNTMPRTSWERMGSLRVPDLSEEQLKTWSVTYRKHNARLSAIQQELERLRKGRADIIRRSI